MLVLCFFQSLKAIVRKNDSACKITERKKADANKYRIQTANLEI